MYSAVPVACIVQCRKDSAVRIVDSRGKTKTSHTIRVGLRLPEILRGPSTDSEFILHIGIVDPPAPSADIKSIIIFFPIQIMYYSLETAL